MPPSANKPKAAPKPKGKPSPAKKPKNGGQKRRRGVQPQPAQPKTKKANTRRRAARKEKQKLTNKGSVRNLLEGQIASAGKMNCITPCTNVLDGTGDNVYDRVLLTIDEFVFRALLAKPSNFVLTGTNASSPLIGFQTLRGYWLYCFQYYMWKCDCIKSNYVDATSFGNFKIPVGLAKLFQQFAPFVDAVTGSMWQYQLGVLSKTITPAYQSVDSYSTSPDSLGKPLMRYLIHCGDSTSAGAKLAEFATLGDKSLQTASAVSSSFADYLKTISPTVQQAIQSLFPATIDVDSIPRHAPDGSAYVFITSTGVIGAFPNFRSDMAVICGRGYQQVPFDINNNLLYDKPLTTARVYDGVNELGPSSTAYAQTIRAVYAYITAMATKWNVGVAIALANSTKCFSDLEDFSYRSKAIDLSFFARRILNAYKTAVWDTNTVNNTAANLTYMYCMTAWNALITRVFQSSSVYSTGDVGTNSCFWNDNMRGDSTKLIPTVAEIVSGTGPIKVNGKVLFPYLGTTDTINSPVAASNISWTKAVSSSGAWNLSNVGYGFGVSAVANGTVNITYPGTTIPVSRTDPPNIVYGCIMTNTGNSFADTFQNAYPEAFVIDSCGNVANEKCGRLQSVLTNVAHDITQATTSVWQNSLLTVNGTDSFAAVYADYCASSDILSEAMANNVLFSPEVATTYIRPLRFIPGAAVQDVNTVIQNNVNSGQGSQFRQQQKAQYLNKLNGRGTNMKDTTFQLNRTIIAQEAINALSAIIPNGSGDRTDFKTSMYDLTKGALMSAGKEILSLGVSRLGGQGVSGDIQEYIKAYYPMLIQGKFDVKSIGMALQEVLLKKKRPELLAT